MKLKYLIEKEFKQIRRNAIIPKMIVGYPVMALLIFPWAISFEVKDIKIEVVDNAKSVYSQRLINKISASSCFVLSGVPADYRGGFNRIEQGEADILLEVPASFDTQMVKEGHASVIISANAVNSMQGLLGSNYLIRIINDFSEELRTELYPEVLSSTPAHIDVVPNYRYNPKLDYKSFMIPAFIVLIITLICGILPALNIVIEKETGTIRQINVTPVNKSDFILAKLIPYWVIGFVILSLSFISTWLIYGLLPSGSFFTLYVCAGIFILGITGLGILVSNYSETLQQAMFLIMFFILIIILLSGMFTPVSSMPSWAQVIAYANPLTHFIEIMRLVYLKGSNLTDLLKPMARLAGFAVVLNTWAVVSYKKCG